MKKFWLKFKKWILTILGIGVVVTVVLFGGTSDDTTIAKLTEKYDKATEIKSKYVLDGATLKATPKDNPKDRIEVTIGNKPVAGALGGETNFEPTVTIARWDDEVNVSIKPKDFDTVALKDRTLKFDKEKIIFETPKVDYKLYELPISEANPEGGMEFEVILKEQPKSNVIEFTLQDKDVEYFYQPELTAEEIAQGASRPENVVGSYAVYAKTPKTNWTGGKEYKVGKVGHIFRPKIIDSAGTEVWGELHIENGILTYTIDWDFLNKAVYPVSIK